MRNIHIHGSTFRHGVSFFEADGVTPKDVTSLEIFASITDCGGCTKYIDLEVQSGESSNKVYLYSQNTESLPFGDLYLKIGYIIDGNIINHEASKFTNKY